MSQIDYLLHESPVGYAVFKVQMQADTIGNRLKEVQEKVQDLARFGKMVDLVGFAPFQGAAHALENANDISEGIVSDYLRTVLDTNLPNVGKKHKLVLGVSDKNLANGIKTAFNYVECETGETSEVVADLLRGLRLHASKLLKQLQEGDVERAQLGLGHAYSRAKVKFSVQKNDNHIIQAIATLDHLDKAVNQFGMRVREWYSWHFPELIKIVSDNLTYAKLAHHIGDKTKLSDSDIHDIAAVVNNDSDIATSIVQAARNSMGRELTEADMENVMAFAQRAVSLAEYRTTLYNYLVSKMGIVAPNLAALIGETVGARLISQAGSLTNLAKYPASTIQILGAEKALFRALKTKGNTPKYGLIYHSSFIGRAGLKNKGRVSRFLANKCSIASRIDNFSEKPSTTFGDALRKQVEERLEFYATGASPTKNQVAMQKAMDDVLANVNVEDPTAAGTEDVVMADGVTAQATEQVVRKKKSKEEKKKEKKEKKEKKKTEKTNGVEDIDMDGDGVNGVDEKTARKEKKRDKKRKLAEVNGDADEEKKKKKEKKAKA
ncbi:MAG: snoRNP complex protein nop56 [Bathelium mastoideum]|nr:MAG: snoRNP complex protein nop56 [Bathelium mastoideum]